MGNVEGTESIKACVSTQTGWIRFCVDASRRNKTYRVTWNEALERWEKVRMMLMAITPNTIILSPSDIAVGDEVCSLTKDPKLMKSQKIWRYGNDSYAFLLNNRVYLSEPHPKTDESDVMPPSLYGEHLDVLAEPCGCSFR